MDHVSEKVALVTGAALGIGRATAELLAREGAKVVVSDIKEQEGRAVVQNIKESGWGRRFRAPGRHSGKSVAANHCGGD